MKNIIVTDCLGTKFSGLKGVLDKKFGMHNYELVSFENDGEEFADPKSYEQMCENIESRITNLHQKFVGIKKDPAAMYYYVSLKKGFLKNHKSNTWSFIAMAGFCKFSEPISIGLSEGVALKEELWDFMELPPEERCKQFKTIYPFMDKESLIKSMNGTEEVDWYRQALRNCIPYKK